MYNENETNLISGVVNAADAEEFPTEERADVQIADVAESDGQKPAAEVENSNADDKATVPADVEGSGADDKTTAPTKNEDSLLDSDIVERIIDRVVERIASAPGSTATNDAPTDEPKGQRCSTPNFLSDIRPDFWDRL